MDTQISSIVFFVAFSTAILLLLTAFVINLLLVSRNKRLLHQAKIMELQNEFDKELTRTQLEVTENTLNDIARDLHDDVGQMLTLSIMQIRNLPLSEEKELAVNVSAIEESIRTTLQSIRNISRTLSNDYISSFGIRSALTTLGERIERSGSIKTDFHIPEDIFFQSKSNELLAFRILQELISNSLKYSQATEIGIYFENESEQLKIVFHDNGKGIEQLPNDNDLHTGLGLRNIRHRVDLMKGNLFIDANSGKGFYLNMTIPNV